MRIIALELKEQKDFDRIIMKMQTIMAELAEIDRLIKAAEKARKRYEELKNELAKVCKEYADIYDEE